MRISDWSSDVCSSDLAAPQQRAHRQRGIGGVLRSPECEERERKEYFDLAHRIAHEHRAAGQPGAVARDDAQAHQPLARRSPPAAQDRSSVGWGTRVSVSRDQDERCIIEKKDNKINKYTCRTREIRHTTQQI